MKVLIIMTHTFAIDMLINEILYQKIKVIIDKSEPAHYICIWLFSEIFISLLFLTQMIADDLRLIGVWINHVYNDKPEKMSKRI